MAAPRPRRDLYGAPLPGLAPNERPPRLQSAQNQWMLQEIPHLLATHYAHLFQPGVYGTIQMTLTIEDGTLQEHTRVQTKQEHRHRRQT